MNIYWYCMYIRNSIFRHYISQVLLSVMTFKVSSWLMCGDIRVNISLVRTLTIFRKNLIYDKKFSYKSKWSSVIDVMFQIIM